MAIYKYVYTPIVRFAKLKAIKHDYPVEIDMADLPVLKQSPTQIITRPTNGQVYPRGNN